MCSCGPKLGDLEFWGEEVLNISGKWLKERELVLWSAAQNGGDRADRPLGVWECVLKPEWVMVRSPERDWMWVRFCESPSVGSWSLEIFWIVSPYTFLQYYMNKVLQIDGGLRPLPSIRQLSVTTVEQRINTILLVEGSIYTNLNLNDELRACTRGRDYGCSGFMGLIEQQ